MSSVDPDLSSRFMPEIGMVFRRHSCYTSLWTGMGAQLSDHEARRALEAVETEALHLMQSFELHKWTFHWDRARRRLGCCRYETKRISLSAYFVLSNLDNQHQIRDTILHEIAHALSWERHGRAGRGHGELWKQICREIGACPKAMAPADVSVAGYKYILRLKTTGEVVGHYHRRPSFSKHLSRIGLRNKPETMGQLELVRLR